MLGIIGNESADISAAKEAAMNGTLLNEAIPFTDIFNKMRVDTE